MLFLTLLLFSPFPLLFLPLLLLFPSSSLLLSSFLPPLPSSSCPLPSSFPPFPLLFHPLPRLPSSFPPLSLFFPFSSSSLHLLFPSLPFPSPLLSSISFFRRQDIHVSSRLALKSQTQGMPLLQPSKHLEVPVL